MSGETREDKEAICLIFEKLFKQDFPCIFSYIKKQEKEKINVRRAVEAGETFGCILADSCNRALSDILDDDLRDEVALELETLKTLMNDKSFSSLYSGIMFILLNANFYKDGDTGFTMPIELNEKGEIEVGEISEIEV